MISDCFHSFSRDLHDFRHWPSPKFAKLSKILWKIGKFWEKISVDQIHSGAEGHTANPITGFLVLNLSFPFWSFPFLFLNCPFFFLFFLLDFFGCEIPKSESLEEWLPKPGGKTCFDVGKIGFCHCAVILHTQVQKLCTALDLGLLYILILGTYSKFARKIIS